MSCGPMHEHQVDLCVELAEPDLRSFLQRNIAWAKLGAQWHDTMVPPTASPDRDRVLEWWRQRNASLVHPLTEWGLADETACIRRHFIYAPDWYIRRMRAAIDEGNAPKAAVLWGILLHCCEYLTASKSSSMILHDLPAELAWAERWLVNGHPFQDEFIFQDGDGAFRHARNLSAVRQRMASNTGQPCCEVYRNLLRRHYFRFFPDELQWLIDYEEQGGRRVYERYEDLCFQETAGTLSVALAALRDVLRPRREDARGADVLFLVRDDLWRRAEQKGPVTPGHRVVEGLRYVSAAVKLGLLFDLWSGEGAPDTSGYRAVVALSREPEPGTIAAPGIADERGFQPFFQSLRAIFGDDKAPEASHWTSPKIVDSLRRLADLRRPRCALAAAPRSEEHLSSETLIGPQGRTRCVFWDGEEHPNPEKWVRPDAGRGEWIIKAPAHATLLYERSMRLPKASRIALRFTVRLQETIAVGMAIECESGGDRRELAHMQVESREPREFALDLTPYAGRTVTFHLSWDAGHDFGYEDKDTLLLRGPEITWRP